jgi:N-methylhydantoinase A
VTEFTPPFRIGVDVGGTFTDTVVVSSAGRLKASKTSSEPSDPEASVLSALSHAAANIGMDLSGLLRNCSVLIHGSTIAVNTILEKKGARVGLLTTFGHRDSLEIRRGIRRNVWNYREPGPEVLVPRYLRRPVRGRLDARGAELAPLMEEDVAAAISLFRPENVESIAICFLHSYCNSAHEHRARALIDELWPEIWVSCSADVAPILGEYERTSTTVLNAYVAPRVVPYLSALQRKLYDLGLRTELLLMQSNGGAISVNETADRPIHLALSGPAAGVGALQHFGADSGASRLIAVEIGGTSCDVTLAVDGAVAMTDQIDISDYPISLPAIQIHTVGAGGGTIAYVDPAGLLHAGPQGAGARPGPAAYGLGGEQPTVTDAQLVLGRLQPNSLAAAAIDLKLEFARAAVETHVARPLGLTTVAAAAGIVRLVEQNVRNAVERVCSEHGHNPRRFTLVAAGGAGPLHGGSVARTLGCKAVYVPRLAGVFCAFGMCNADLRHDYQRPWLAELDQVGDGAAITRAFDELAANGRAVLRREGFDRDTIRISRAMDLRYSGQQWTIQIHTPEIEERAIRAAFEVEHERLYGYRQERGRIEIVILRVTATGPISGIMTDKVSRVRTKAQPTSRRLVWLDETHGQVDTPIFDGSVLWPGHTIDGPAIIDEKTTTILVGLGDRLIVTPGNNFLLTIDEVPGSAGQLLELAEGVNAT